MDENGAPNTLTEEQMQPQGDGEQQQPNQAQQPQTPTGNQPQGTEELEIAQDPVQPKQQEQPVSRRESKRIEQLLKKFGYDEAPQQRPQQRQQPTFQPQFQGQTGNQGVPQIIGEGDYDLDEVNRKAYEWAQQFAQQQMSGSQNQQQEVFNQTQMMQNASNFATRLEIEEPRVSGKYAFMDTANEEQFDPGVASFINSTYLSVVGYDQRNGTVQNTNLRYSEFVDGFMEVVELVSQALAADGNKAAVQQVARAGVRPGGKNNQPYTGDDPRQMSDEQLKAKIAEGLGAPRP